MKSIFCNSVDKRNRNTVQHMTKPHAPLYHPEMMEPFYITRAASRSSPCTVMVITDHSYVQQTAVQTYTRIKTKAANVRHTVFI